MNYVRSLSINGAVDLINKAQYEDKRDKTYAWWLARVPMYTPENYETYEDFYEKVYPPITVYDTRSKDEIMEELLRK